MTLPLDNGTRRPNRYADTDNGRVHAKNPVPEITVLRTSDPAQAEGADRLSRQQESRSHDNGEAPQCPQPFPRKRPTPVYPPVKHKVQYAKAMTIATGFVCTDGIVIAADTEMTGYAKYQGRKVWWETNGGCPVRC